MEQKYYWMSYVYKPVNADNYAFDSAATQIHPLIRIGEIYRRSIMDCKLITWREITREEYEMINQ